MGRLILANRRIPKGEWVLVTGANGYIASHIVDVLLCEGYKIRGTLRSHEEAPWLEPYFTDKYGVGNFEIAIVTDLTDATGFERAAANMSGIIHSASILPSTSDVEAVVPSVTAGTRNALNAAAKHPSVKSFVLTSSSSAAYMSVFVKKDVIVDEPYSKNTPPSDLPLKIYAASKTLGERALWEWTEQEKPTFTVNAVLPSFNIGKPLTAEVTTGSVHPVRAIVRGADPWFEVIRPHSFVNVRDNAYLHVAALLDPTIRSQRIFASAGKYNWNDIISIFRKLRPDNRLIPDPPQNEPRDLTNVDAVSKRAETLLKSSFDVAGWTGLGQSLAESLEDFE
ncbi:hypothetical protein H2200_008750 [Cladophialophora chaetospira]|uniref:NAD-dependent epimerase/dehydratase domain-containing protein n=1 Tax=Cladophialophora chaetospira TaxID=386627 RepID=A0AA38X4N8_9EURO|nr:hypothetical protein H2200_008750 [Cladophialophora chaetospira]